MSSPARRKRPWGKETTDGEIHANPPAFSTMAMVPFAMPGDRRNDDLQRRGTASAGRPEPGAAGDGARKRDRLGSQFLSGLAGEPSSRLRPQRVRLREGARRAKR